MVKQFKNQEDMLKYMEELQKGNFALNDRILKALNLIEDYQCTLDYCGGDFKLVEEVFGKLQRILSNNEWEHEFELGSEE